MTASVRLSMPEGSSVCFITDERTLSRDLPLALSSLMIEHGDGGATMRIAEPQPLLSFPLCRFAFLREQFRPCRRRPLIEIS